MMDIALNEVIHFDAVTSDSTGAATDADSTPSWEVFEEDTDTAIQSGNFTKRTSKTGNYRGTATLSTANGFEVGKWYSVVASATVDSVTGKAVVKSFRVVAAENTAGVPVVDVGYVAGESATTESAPTAAEIADEVETRFPANFAALGINVSGHISRVTLVDTTTTNTDMRGTDGAYTGTPPTAVAIRQEIDSNSTQLAAIVADTNELQTDWANGGRLDLLLDGRATPAQVNEQVLDVLNVDTFAEPGQGTPPATATLVQKIGYLFKAWRNKKTQSSSEQKLFADDGTTVDQKASVSDDGSTLTVGEVATGP